jgi:hypothetical protein
VVCIKLSTGCSQELEGERHSFKSGFPSITSKKPHDSSGSYATSVLHTDYHIQKFLEYTN